MSLNKKITYLLVSTSLVSAAQAMEPQLDENGVRVIGDRILRVGDTESAMDPAVYAVKATAFETVYERTGHFSQQRVDAQFQGIKTFIQAQPITKKRKLEAGRLRYPTGLSESRRGNALRALEGERIVLEGGNDFGAIAENSFYTTLANGTVVRMKEFLARVWHIITNHPNAAEQNLMKSSLFTNLNYCIEDDGHRTCDAGKTTRIFNAIEGFVEGVNITVNMPIPRDFVVNYRTEEGQRLEGLARQGDEFALFICQIGDWDSTAQALSTQIQAERQRGQDRIDRLYGLGTRLANEAKFIIDQEVFAGYLNVYSTWLRNNPDKAAGAPVPFVPFVMPEPVPAQTRAQNAEPEQSYEEMARNLRDLGLDDAAIAQNWRDYQQQRQAQQSHQAQQQQRQAQQPHQAQQQQHQAQQQRQAQQQDGDDWAEFLRRVQQPRQSQQQHDWVEQLRRVEQQFQSVSPTQARQAQRAAAKQQVKAAAQARQAQRVAAKQQAKAAAQARQAQRAAAKHQVKAAAQVRKAQRVAAKRQAKAVAQVRKAQRVAAKQQAKAAAKIRKAEQALAKRKARAAAKVVAKIRKAQQVLAKRQAKIAQNVF